jgi:hypothetical protein
MHDDQWRLRLGLCSDPRKFAVADCFFQTACLFMSRMLSSGGGAAAADVADVADVAAASGGLQNKTHSRGLCYYRINKTRGGGSKSRRRGVLLLRESRCVL